MYTTKKNKCTDCATEAYKINQSIQRFSEDPDTRVSDDCYCNSCRWFRFHCLLVVYFSLFIVGTLGKNIHFLLFFSFFYFLLFIHFYSFNDFIFILFTFFLLMVIKWLKANSYVLKCIQHL